jgi:pimeloyl-ACP methyl ester carboxylesterase
VFAASTSTFQTTGVVASKDGTTIGYRQLGQGPGVILVHGGMQASQHLMPLAAALSDSFTLYVPDRRGRGMSGPHGADYHIATECDDLKALLIKSGAKYVFGLSSGALIAMQAALAVPEIRKLVLYEPPLSIDHSSPTAWVFRFDREVADGQLSSAFVTALKGVQISRWLNCLPRFALVPLLDLACKKEKVKSDDVPIQALIPTVHFDVQLVSETEGTLERFKAVFADVLLLGGSKSPAYLQLALDALAKVLPHATQVKFRGLDHLGPTDDGDALRVAAEVRRFLA